MTSAIPPWLAVMRSLDGTHAEGDNPAILAWPKFIGQQYPEMAAYCAGYTHDSISWCGLAIAYCMAKAGIRPVFGPSDTDRFLWALAWKEFGDVVPLNQGLEQPGDVLIFIWADKGHHVTLYEGTDGGNYICHGGNQSHAVNQQHYSQAYCVGIRRPPAVVMQKTDPSMQQEGGFMQQPPLSMHAAGGASAPMDGFLLTEIERWAVNRSPAVAQWKADVLAKLRAAEQQLSAGPQFALDGPTLRGLPLPLPLPPPGAPSAPAAAPAAAGQRFMACVALVLQSEGGNDDDPRDPGGRTSRGITKGDWDEWLKTHPGLPTDVWQAPQDQIIAIYHEKYWTPLECDQLPAGVDYAVFDEGVLEGIGHAARALESIVGTGQDGEIGPLTIAAAAAADPRALVNQLCDARLAYLRGRAGWPTYGHGWTNRVDSVRAAALKMAASSQSATTSQGASAMSTPGDTNTPPQIPAFLLNWKTSAAGAIPILLACVDILQMITNGHLDQTHLYADLGAFAAGFGLVGAQDARR